MIFPAEKALKSFKWTIDSKSAVRLTDSGDISIDNGLLNLVDRAPEAFLKSGEELSINFHVDGHHISFKIDGVTPLEWPLKVDPWVTDLDTLFAEVLNVETDNLGNSYVYVNTFINAQDQVRKYDNNGTLLWSNIYSSVSYTDGDLEVDQETNSIFVSSIGSIGKFDENGINLWTTLHNEAWTLEFNCSENQFVGAGMTFPVTSSRIVNLDPETGEPITNFFQPNDSLPFSGFFTTGANEIRSMTSSPQGDYYFLAQEYVLKMCSGLQLKYQLPNHHNSIYYSGPLYHNAAGGGSGGSGFIGPWGEYNAIAVDSQYLYTYDGHKLMQRLSFDGTIIDSLFVANGQTVLNGGIIVDNCGDVFIGGQSYVYKLDNSLTYLDSIPVSTPVFDLAFGDSNQIIICGLDNVTSVTFNHCYKQVCNPPDTLPYTFSPDTVLCKGESVLLTASGGSSYSWFPDYNISSIDSSHVLVAPDTTTTYGVLIKFDSCTYRLGYVRVYVDTFTRYNLPPDTTICEDDSVFLSVSGTASSFLVENSTGTYSQVDTSFILKPDSNEIYTISSIGLDSSQCKTDYAITVLSKPASIPIDSLFQCTNDTIEVYNGSSDSIVWSPEEYLIEIDSSLYAAFPSTQFLHYEISDHGICKWSDSILIHVQPLPKMNIPFSEAVICLGDTITFPVSGAEFYTWNPDSSVVQIDSSVFLLKPDSNAQYLLTGLDSFGCFDTVSISFKTKPPTISDIVLNDTVVCVDDEVLINVRGTGNLFFTDSSTLERIGKTAFVHHAYRNSKLTLISEQIGYCSDTDHVQIFVHSFPESESIDTVICRGESMLLNVASSDVVNLWPQHGVEQLSDSLFALSPNEDIRYVFVSDIGCTGVDTINVRVMGCDFFIPNVMTPNGDGSNDFFKLKSESIAHSMCQIYNRWGKKVYEGDPNKFPWDGSIKNRPAPNGTYFYSIDITTHDGESINLRGEVTLIRE
ncbi:MAG: hypothetical protein Salg2KO_10470 [Salibacteraceae bacterium]